MKKLFLLLYFVCIGFSSVEAQSIKLPNECRNILNKKFRGWKLAKISDEIIKFYRENKSSFEPNFIKGDWNGDKKADYAILIEQGKLKNFQGSIIGERRLIVIFVRTQKGFNYFRFDGSDFIQLIKKGTKDYNYETDKDFRYKNDAIFDGFWEKAGVSYVWKKGKFIEIVTSD